MSLSVGPTVILLALTLLSGFGIASVSDVSVVQITFAYSPGSFAEMSITAPARHMDVESIVAHTP